MEGLYDWDSNPEPGFVDAVREANKEIYERAADPYGSLNSPSWMKSCAASEMRSTNIFVRIAETVSESVRHSASLCGIGFNLYADQKKALAASWSPERLVASAIFPSSKR